METRFDNNFKRRMLIREKEFENTFKRRLPSRARQQFQEEILSKEEKIFFSNQFDVFSNLLTPRARDGFIDCCLWKMKLRQ